MKIKKPKLKIGIAVPAGALFFAVIFALVISLITLLIITSGYLHSVYSINLTKSYQYIVDVNSGVNYFMSDVRSFPNGQTKTIDLYGDEKNQVEITSVAWGAFKLGTVTTVSGIENHGKSVLVGTLPDQSNARSLVLSDKGKKLKITGSTKIVGSCLLPEIGVERAYIEGRSYAGSKLIYGEVGKSGKELPKLNAELLAEVSQLLSGGGADSIISFENHFENHDSLFNGFRNKAVKAQSQQELFIGRQVIAGKVIIHSTKSITINRNAQIEEAIIVAPQIFIEDGFEGSLQCYASDSIVIGKNVDLLFPSVVGMVSANKGSIQVGEGTEVKGAIFTSGTNSANPPFIGMGRKTELIGYLYSAGMLDLKGKVKGSVYTDEFILKTASSYYSNHLMNCSIDRSQLPVNFVGVDLLESSESSQTKIIKQL